MTTNKNCQECDDCGGNAAQVMPPQNESNCPQPNPCTSVTDSRCVYHLGDNVLCGTDIIITTEDTQDDINKAIIEYMCEKFEDLSGARLTSLTYVQSQTLVTNNGIEVGTKYFITDRGILLTGVATNLFSVEGQRIMRVVKGSYYTPSGVNKGIWFSGISVATNDITIWGGKCWKNLTGSTGSADNDWTLNAFDWELIPTTNNTYYEGKSFFVIYNHSSDWVVEQRDNKGNVFGVPIELSTFNSFVDYCDWGSPFVYKNVCRGVFNNVGSVVDNIVRGYITKNLKAVTSNRNEGNITLNNILVGANSNRGDITNISSAATKVCFYNSNNGDIKNCTVTGNIINNKNNGDIKDLTSTTVDVFNNVNNGSIQTTVVGNITDTIVNK